MLVSIVGGTGVLGRKIVFALLEQKYKVRLLARSPEKAALVFPNLNDIKQCDLLSAKDRKNLPGLIEGSDVFIHAASDIPYEISNKKAWENTAIIRTEGTKALLDACLKTGVKQYIQQSIAMAYADGGENWLDEQAPFNEDPERIHFSEPVRIMEEMVKALPSDKIEWNILRGGMLVGPGTKQEVTISRLKAGIEKMTGNGQNFMSLVNATDLARAYILSIKQHPVNSVFNIVDDPIREEDYYNQLSWLYNVPPPKKSKTSVHVPSFRCSNLKARVLLGWYPEQPIFPSI